MSIFQNAKNIVINSGSFNDIHGNIHTYNSIQATNVNSLTNINPTVNGFNAQPTSQIPHQSAEPAYNYVSPASSFTSNSAFSSSGSIVNSYAGIDQNIHQFISQPVVPDAHEIEDSVKIEEIVDAEDIVSDDDNPNNRTYQFYNCQTVYINSLNARGVRVKDSGNHFPQVTYHDGTVVVRPSNDVNQGVSSSSKSQLKASLDQLSRYQGVPPESTFGSPPIIPPLPFQRREDTSSSSSAAQSEPPNIPTAEIPTGPRSNNPFLRHVLPTGILPPTFEEGQASMPQRNRDKLPATIETTKMQVSDAISHQYSPKIPAPTTLLDPDFHPLIRPFLPKHMDIYSNFRSPPLKPFPDDIRGVPPNNNITHATNSSLDSPDTYSRRLEHHLDSALATALIIHTSGTSSSTEILTPRAQNTLKALNALVSSEPPRTITSDPPTRFKSVRKVTKWLRISRSPK